MAEEFGMELIASILDGVSQMIFLEKMELAMVHLRARIDYLIHHHPRMHLFYNSFKEDTRAYLNRILHDLDVNDAWDFFLFQPIGVQHDLEQFWILHEVRDFICFDILQDLVFDAWGLTSSSEQHVQDYLNGRAHREF